MASRWDADPYLTIARDGYRADALSHVAYFPLYPFLMRMGGALFGSDEERTVLFIPPNARGPNDRTTGPPGPTAVKANDPEILFRPDRRQRDRHHSIVANRFLEFRIARRIFPRNDLLWRACLLNHRRKTRGRARAAADNRRRHFCVAFMNFSACAIDSFISSISFEMSTCIFEASPCSAPIACAFRLCLKNST